MKFHRHLVESIFLALEDIFKNNYYADKVIERNLKANKKWGSRDRKYFAETIYEIVRWKRLLSEVAGSEQPEKLWLVYTLRQGLTPPQWLPDYGYTLAETQKRLAKIKDKAVLESVPAWLFARGQKEIGERWDEVLHALNQPADVYLRANALKISAPELQELLLKEEIETELSSDPALPYCLKLKERKNVFITEAFKKGLFEVQDASSQKVVPLLDLQPGLRVVDACAGAGGKTLHMASLMKNKGKIIAMDIHEWKLKELKTRVARGGVDIVETRAIEGTKSVKRLEKSFDRVLLDVPCSGLGVLRRNPDTKWKLSNEEISRLQDLQQEILMNYSEMCKVGGKMVYATCSLLPSENRQQVDRFLASKGESWDFVSDLSLDPAKDGSDGFYAALLIRKA